MLLKFIGSKLLKKILIEVAGVLVKRTDNTLDDDLYEAIKKVV